MVKTLSVNAGDTSSIPGLGRSSETRSDTLSSILAWKIPWTEEPGRLQFMGSQESHITQRLTTNKDICPTRHPRLVLFKYVKTHIKLGKEYDKAAYCHAAYLTYMQSISCEMPGWMKHKLESILVGEISTSDMQMIPC